MRIIIDIDVTNPEEVVKAHRGELVGIVAGVLLSKENRKIRVEKAVCEEIIKVLETELPKGLQEEMVEANISFAIEDDSIDSEDFAM